MAISAYLHSLKRLVRGQGFVVVAFHRHDDLRCCTKMIKLAAGYYREEQNAVLAHALYPSAQQN